MKQRTSRTASAVIFGRSVILVCTRIQSNPSISSPTTGPIAPKLVDIGPPPQHPITAAPRPVTCSCCGAAAERLWRRDLCRSWSVSSRIATGDAGWKAWHLSSEDSQDAVDVVSTRVPVPCVRPTVPVPLVRLPLRIPTGEVGSDACICLKIVWSQCLGVPSAE